MAIFKVEDVGVHFIRDGEVFRLISWTDQPTARLVNIETSVTETHAFSSLHAQEFTRLIEEKE